MQPPAFSSTKTDSNSNKSELNTKSAFKKNSNSTSSWEEGLIFDPKIFEEKTKSFLETFHSRNTKKRELNFENENENENEKEEKEEIEEKKNDDDIDLTSPLVLTISTLKNTSSSFSSFSLSPYTFEKLIFTSFEGRCFESLLRVKSYLKNIYLLSDEKCQLFSPDEKVRKFW